MARERGFHVLVGERRAQIRGAQRLGSELLAGRPVQVPGALERSACRVALVTAGGQEIDLIELIDAVDQHVELDVHEDAAAHRQLADPRLARPRLEERGDQLLDQTLDAGGDVVEPEPRELPLEALDVGVLPEAGAVDDVQTVGREVEVCAQDLVDALRLRAARVRGQAHHLVFVLDGLHAQIARDRRVHHADRLQALVGLETPELVRATGDAHAAAGAVAGVVQRHDQGGVGTPVEVEPVGRVGVTRVMLDQPDLGLGHAVGGEVACELAAPRRAETAEGEIGPGQGR